LNGAILGMHRREIASKFDEIVAFAEVEKFIDTPVKRYSSGMYLRLAFSVAAHLEPEILLVDEVLAVGDAAFQKKCLGKMGDVAQQGRTVLFVSHNMDAISALCSSAILLDQGELVHSGTSGEVVNRYLSGFANHQTEYVKSTKVDASSPAKSIEVNRVNLYKDELYPSPYGDLVCSIEYEVHAESVGTVVAIKIANSRGATALTLIDTDNDLDRFTKQKGVYQAICPLPTHILAPDVYSITVSISNMKSERYEYLESIVQFEALQNELIKNTFSGREGILLTPAEWTINLLEREAEGFEV
jgi:lipopolysaccharide transport system ATP-binding protein